MINTTEFRFTGNTFKLLLLVAILYIGTIFTIGIAYPWLACLCYRWEIKNTVVSGKRQYFDGRGGDLFKKYIVWLFLTIVTLSIYKLWLTRNVMVWKVSHTHFVSGGNDKAQDSSDEAQHGGGNAAQDVSGNNATGTSYYKCGIGEKVVMLIKYYAIIICLLTLASCWAYCYKTRWTLNHTVIDGRRLDFDGKDLQYLGKCALAVLLILVTVGIFALWTPVFLKRWEVKHTMIGE